MSNQSYQSSGSFTLRKRLILTLGAPLLGLLVVAGYALLQFSHIYRSVDTIYRDRVIPLQSLKIIADDYAVLVIDAVNKANSGISTAENARAEIRAAKQRIERVWSEYLATKLTDEESRLVREAEQLFTSADRDLEKSLMLLDGLSGNVRGQLDVIDGPLYETIDPISAKITELVELQLRVAGEEYSISKEAYRDTRIMTGAVIFVVFVVSFLSASAIFLWLIRQVGGEPTKVVRVTQEIADGQLAIDLPENALAGSIMDAVKRLRDNVRPVIEDVQASAGHLSALGYQLHAHIQAAQPQIEKQKDETTQVATAMSEMSATVADVSNSASGAARASQEAEMEVEAGLSVVANSILAIETLAIQLEGAANSVDSVARDSVEIGGILNVIGGIAQQTNLLALNAAIEAARAGDQGRGFAVVADEVRNLAKRTHESTQQIQTMIERLRTNVSQTVSVMNKSLEAAQVSVNLSGEARTRLSNIRHSVSVINDMNTQIASAAVQQSYVAEEIDRNLLAIRDIAYEVGESFVDISATENEIRRVAGVLNMRTAYFKL